MRDEKDRLPAKQIDRETRDAYYKEVDSYTKDRLQWANRMAAAAWFVVLGVGAIASVEGIAIAKLSMRDLPDPVVLRVDNTTGLVDRVYNTAGDIAATDAETRHWLWQFVRSAESYSYAEARPNFDMLTLMSTPNVQKWQQARVGGDNPLSPGRVLGRDGQAVLNWESTTFIGDGLGQVRFTQSERKGENILPARHMVATVAYRFVKGPLSGTALNVNPRGFMVTSYNVEQEGAR